MVFNEELGIDLGTTNTLIFVKNKGIVVNEATCIAIDKRTNEPIAYGNKAKEMLNKNPETINVINPVVDGKIADFKNTIKLLKYFIVKAKAKAVGTLDVIASIPTKISDIDKQALMDCFNHAGVRYVRFMDSTYAAALGNELDVDKPQGLMVVDIGGGVTNISIISNGEVVNGTSINISGNTFDKDIIEFLEKKQFLVENTTAEKVKIEISNNYYSNSKEMYFKMIGKSIQTGLPVIYHMSHEELLEAIDKDCYKLATEIKNVLEKTPPELLEDIAEKGIYLTGGSSMICQLDIVLKHYVGMKINRTTNPEKLTAMGLGKKLK